MIAQPGLCRTGRNPLKTGFLTTRLIYKIMSLYMRKPAFSVSEHQSACQPAHPHILISTTEVFKCNSNLYLSPTPRQGRGKPGKCAMFLLLRPCCAGEMPGNCLIKAKWQCNVKGDLLLLFVFLFSLTSPSRLFHSYRDEPIDRWGKTGVPRKTT